MTLIDAGPMIALLNRFDKNHARCVKTLARLKTPLLTTWPAVAEAMYSPGKAGGWPAQKALWNLLLKSEIIIVALEETLLPCIHELMGKYYDTPMDLADASLVALAEGRNLRRVFTLDGDFRVYRLNGRIAFEVLS